MSKVYKGNITTNQMFKLTLGYNTLGNYAYYLAYYTKAKEMADEFNKIEAKTKREFNKAVKDFYNFYYLELADKILRKLSYYCKKH